MCIIYTDFVLLKDKGLYLNTECSFLIFYNTAHNPGKIVAATSKPKVDGPGSLCLTKLL
jgi:hypothetical protein